MDIKIEEFTTRKLIEMREDNTKCVERFFQQSLLLHNIIEEGKRTGDYKKALTLNFDRVRNNLRGYETGRDEVCDEIEKRANNV